MRSTYTSFSQSRFFNPAFNAAIFDGPLRIYFSQLHESLALKIYFSISQQCPAELEKCKEIHRLTGKTLMILLYPNAETFHVSFDGNPGSLTLAQLEDDDIVGMAAPFEDNLLGDIVNASKSLMKFWEPAETETPFEPLLEIGSP